MPGRRPSGFAHGSRRSPLLAVLGLMLAMPAQAAVIGGVEFPQGELSFADSVVSYTVGSGGVTAANALPANALGLPDYVSGGACTGLPEECSFVSLGSGGELILRFIDNVLTGSGNADPDLWIFEVGPDVESTYVSVSSNGVEWHGVGLIQGSTRSVDLDAFGFGPGSHFAFVRLVDNEGQGGSSGASVGADIDAVGAISTLAVVPLPAAVWLFAGALATLAAFRRGRVRP